MKLKASLLIVSILFPVCLAADWERYYQRDCSTVKSNQVCIQKLKRDLGRMRSYSLMTNYYLKQYGLPNWLMYLPIIESSYNPKAVSKTESGHILALGLWQISPKNLRNFCKLTGGSDCDSLNKEYWQNPEISTHAGCWILSGLFKEFGDWELVLKAYNAGSDRVRGWQNGDELPDETKQYTKQLIAIQRLAKKVRPYDYTIKYLSYIFK